ncbi:MAG: hypothetical protein E6Q40_05175 [Cupriavidus sp.]|nr:MAG: hypothetical protein E6Q40_05175 [Cupriavidus sp.]
MAAQVLSFFQRSPRYAPAPSVDWTQQELAEFYRVESALIRAGIRVGTDRGLSDENEPWFVFYRSDDGEVVIHFARIDGEYLIAGPAYEEIARGFDFTALVRNLVARHPLIRRAESGSNLSVHPAALLVAVVGTAFFKTGEARAAESGATNTQSGHARPVLLSSSSQAGLSSGVAPIGFQQPTYDTVQLPANQAVLVLAAALLASNYQADAKTLDANTQTAIAAAAASLDFGGARAPESHGVDITAVGGQAPHAMDLSADPARMMSSVLSLVSLLSTLPQPVAGNGDAGETSIGQVNVTHSETFAKDESLTPNAANWVIEVRLNHNDVNVVEAVQLVRGIVGDANLQKISVIEVQKLPEVLAKIIAQGEHYNVVAPTPQQLETPNVTTPPTNGSGDSGHTGGDTTLPPLTDNHQDPIDTTPITPEKPTPPSLPSSSYTYTGFATVDMVRSFIDHFVAHTPDVGIITQGREIVMFDTRVMTDPGAIDHVVSQIFHFFDGSTLNLVGAQSSFLHDGVLS